MKELSNEFAVFLSRSIFVGGLTILALWLGRGQIAFFILSIVVMYVGRRLGWALSKRILYTASTFTTGLISAIWGIGVALLMFSLIRWQTPNIVLKIIMGYALGWYVAIPNFGLLQEASIPDHARPRHLMISLGSPLAYIVTMVVVSLLG